MTKLKYKKGYLTESDICNCKLDSISVADSESTSVDSAMSAM